MIFGAPQRHYAAVGERECVELVAQHLILRAAYEVRELRPERRAGLAVRVGRSDKIENRDEAACEAPHLLHSVTRELID